MWKIAYKSGYEDGNKSLDYWNGWSDAMSITKNGTVEYKGQ